MEIVENKKKAKLFNISLLNVFFCMLVVFIHVSSKTISDLDKSSWQYLLVMIPWRLSAFVVQGFIFLSGLKLFLNKSNSIAYGKFFINRLIYIIVPYIVWVFIYYVYFYKNNYFPFNLLDFLKYVLVGDLVGHFYFIIIITQFYLLTPLWLNLIKKVNSIILITFSLMITIVLSQNLPDIINLFSKDFNFQYNDRIFTTYLIYWIVGCYAGLYYEEFKEILRKNRKFISIVFFIVSFFDGILSYLTFSGRKYIYWLENIHIMYCICAILFFYTVSLLFNPQYDSSRQKPRKFTAVAVGLINSIDKVSYQIYLSHCLIIFITNDFLAKFSGISIGMSYFIRFCTVYIITIFGAVFWGSIKKRAVSGLSFLKK